jgi:urease accessory protein
MSILLTIKLSHHSTLEPTDRLLLTAEERTRTRHPFVTEGGIDVYIQIDRGSSLRQGDRLQSEDGSFVVEVVAKPELIFAVTTDRSISLLEAAYHLGNRHVALEITTTHLYLLPDSVLRDLFIQRGLLVTEIVRPFQPQAGAYEHHHH